MADILCVRTDWDRTALPLPIASRFFTLHISPEPEHPAGRKGLGLVRMWEQLAAPDAAGMLILDGDVAIDPEDFAQMLTAVGAAPGAVHTAPVRLWPASTHLKTWVWGHGRGRYSNVWYEEGLDTFTFCFTYLPRTLTEACIGAGMAEWHYPHVDRNTVRQARQLGLTVNLVQDCSPKHANY